MAVGGWNYAEVWEHIAEVVPDTPALVDHQRLRARVLGAASQGS